MERSHVDWPFFDDAHRVLAADLGAWAAKSLASDEPADVNARCRALVRMLGGAGWLRYCVPASHGGALAGLDSRALCVARETLAYHDGLADFAFAMQGLGSGAITLTGSEAQKARWLPAVATGAAIAAFALSEPDAGSDVAAMTTRARRDGDTWVLDGCKTWISNGGIADFYCVFARSGDGAGTGTGTSTGTRGISAFIVPADVPGLTIGERIEVIAPHPLARLTFTGCRVPADALLGVEGEGFKLAMRTLDIFRASVAAAALGFARRALDETLGRTRERRMFGTTLSDLQLTQAKLAEMATAIDASALLTYRAAWLRDVRQVRTTKEAAMAKLTATESAQQVIDAAVQLFGGLGVTRGQVVERLYREIRALRIYEGATEVQKLIVARELLRHGTGSTR
jgi:alkylation response protein AidB-like acyl-CoA dehydrogenase